MVSTLPLHLRIKGSHKGKVLLRCERKKAQCDLVTFSLSPPYGYALFVCFCFLVLSQSSFMLCVFLYVLVWLFFSLCLFFFS